MTGLQNKARQYALKLLSYRGRSEKELEERLMKKGFSKSETSSTINYLKDIGLVDDMVLAETLKREALTTKMLSRNGAKQYMLKRGISREIANLAFTEDKDSDFGNARKLVNKKLKVLKDYPAETAKRRLYNFLLRRGYSSYTIFKAFKDIHFKEDET